MVRMRTEILKLKTAATPELSFKPGAPLIHPARGLMPGVGNDKASGRSGGTNPRDKWIGQGGYRQSSGIATGENCGVWRVRVQKSKAIGLVRVVIDAATGAEHGLLADPVRDSQARRPVRVIGSGEVVAGCSPYDSRLVWI